CKTSASAASLLMMIGVNVITEFCSFTSSGLIAEVKKLHDVAYQLGLEEAKEMTRKYLNILTRRHR
ncbi:hypothetical protein Cfor_12902, partial [Coptotermes formosanus]